MNCLAKMFEWKNSSSGEHQNAMKINMRGGRIDLLSVLKGKETVFEKRKIATGHIYWVFFGSVLSPSEKNIILSPCAKHACGIRAASARPLVWEHFTVCVMVSWNDFLGGISHAEKTSGCTKFNTKRARCCLNAGMEFFFALLNFTAALWQLGSGIERKKTPILFAPHPHWRGMHFSPRRAACTHKRAVFASAQVVNPSRSERGAQPATWFYLTHFVTLAGPFTMD
jgi:hypothetical protein